MTDYGYDPDETHENMHIHRWERHYKGHKLAVAVGHNKTQRKNGAETLRRERGRVK